VILFNGGFLLGLINHLNFGAVEENIHLKTHFWKKQVKAKLL